MIFLLQEEIDDYEKFSQWFNNDAVPQIEAAGGRVLVQGVELENENMVNNTIYWLGLIYWLWDHDLDKALDMFEKSYNFIRNGSISVRLRQ